MRLTRPRLQPIMEKMRSPAFLPRLADMSGQRLTLIAGLSFLLFLNSRATLAQTASEQAIVDSFYPVARLHPDQPDRRETCYQVATADADGKATRIVAGYTDTDEAVLRVLDREPSGAFRISYESPADLDMYARDCEITVADLDGDGSKDVFMELSADKGSYAWMFRGVGTTLEPLQNTS